MTEVENTSDEELEALCEKKAEAFILRLRITKDRLKLFLDGELLRDKKDIVESFLSGPHITFKVRRLCRRIVTPSINL